MMALFCFVAIGSRASMQSFRARKKSFSFFTVTLLPTSPKALFIGTFMGGRSFFTYTLLSPYCHRYA